MKLKRFVSMVMALMLVVGLAAGCGKSKKEEAQGGSVYFLNFKPEVAEVWEKIAKEYTKETGVPMKVITAAAGTYESTLKSEIAKKGAPTLFQVTGPVGYKAWKDYCKDLKDTKLYSWLLDKSMAIGGEDGGVYGIPYVVESYGIIYNEAIMRKYYALSNAKVKSSEEINSFEKLKEVVEDMTARKDELEIEGVFASTSFSPGEDWRWQTHLANVPQYYEFKEDGVDEKKEFEFRYNENYKNIFDLYLNNSCTEPKMLGAKSVADSMAEFALGKVAMVQNGNWAWSQIAETDGNIVTQDNVKFMPIYTGMKEDEEQGLCTGSGNFMCINSQTSEENQKASEDFLEWLFNTEVGKNYVTNELNFITPFDTFAEAELPSDPLAKEVIRYMGDSNMTSVSWVFLTMPGEEWKSNFGASLLEYAQGSKKWKTVVEDMKTSWKDEMKMIQ